MVKKSATYALKTSSKKVIHKTIKAAGKIVKVSRSSPQIIQKQLQMIMIKKYLKKDISSEEREGIIDDLNI